MGEFIKGDKKGNEWGGRGKNGEQLEQESATACNE